MVNRFQESKDFDSTNFLLFLYHWRKPILIISAIAFIAGLLSFPHHYFITPKFKSTVIMFPTSTGSISKALLSENNQLSKMLCKLEKKSKQNKCYRY